MAPALHARGRCNAGACAVVGLRARVVRLLSHSWPKHPRLGGCLTLVEALTPIRRGFLDG